MDRLAGKTAVITGIGPGIGSAIARAFAREGADLVLAGFANPAFDESIEAARRFGRRVAAVHGDVGAPGGMGRDRNDRRGPARPCAYRRQQRRQGPVRAHSRRP
jgi:NAD(P)-dependent dehydrogenase (short-subunit alcohol dehydrogenase family)